MNIKNIAGIQGDLMIVKVSKVPKTVKKRKGNVILEGESTGNAHRLKSGEVYEDGQSLYLQTIVPTTIIHEEHEEIPLEMPGVHEVVRQRQYDKDNMTKLVVD